jgi:hypothetical protein
MIGCWLMLIVCSRIKFNICARSAFATHISNASSTLELGTV